MKPLLQQRINAQLCSQAQSLLKELIILENVDSTNDYLLKIADRAAVIACFAERQSAGKGQRGKSWQSPQGQIYFSLMWPFSKPALAMAGLSLAVGIASVRAVIAYGLDAARSKLAVKWPNDIYVDGKKLAGILVETMSLGPEKQNSIIGIGLNICPVPEQNELIDQPWASLESILGQEIDRNRFAGLLLNELILALVQFDKHGLSLFQREWRAFDYLFGKKIRLSTPQCALTGIANGISSRGELILIDDRQNQHVCHSGSVKLAV